VEADHRVDRVWAVVHAAVVLQAVAADRHVLRVEVEAAAAHLGEAANICQVWFKPAQLFKDRGIYPRSFL
jgi:hypothetical protein